MKVVRIKICGITRAVDAVAAEAAGADSIGLMFVPESPRFIDMASAREISAAAGPLLLRVGVFRDAPLEQVLDVAQELRLGAVQLHGSEEADYVREVGKRIPVIKALSYSAGLRRELLEGYPADGVLVDGLRPGSGRAFDWSAALPLRSMPRLILAGGLDPGNVAAGIAALLPYGVDVSSGVEERPGIKSPQLMAAFVQAARAAAREPVR